jgi:uncharacterized protein YqfB (UPF0267 family)
MFCHHFDSLLPCRLIIIRQKTPGISESTTSYHESCKVLSNSKFKRQSSKCRTIIFYISIILLSALCSLHSLYAIFITLTVTIAENRDFQCFLKFFNWLPIGITSIFLFISPTMDRDETGSCLFECLSEFYEFFCTTPSEASLHCDRYFQIFSEDVHDLHCSITIDHESTSVSAFDDFLRRTTHIDIHALCSV